MTSFLWQHFLGIELLSREHKYTKWHSFLTRAEIGEKCCFFQYVHLCAYHSLLNGCGNIWPIFGKCLHFVMGKSIGKSFFLFLTTLFDIKSIQSSKRHTKLTLQTFNFLAIFPIFDCYSVHFPPSFSPFSFHFNEELSSRGFEPLQFSSKLACLTDPATDFLPVHLPPSFFPFSFHFCQRYVHYLVVGLCQLFL